METKRFMLLCNGRWPFHKGLLLAAIAACAWAIALNASQDRVSTATPSYVLKLTLNEYSLLTASEVDGLQKYGGSGDFKIQMAKEGSMVMWTVTIDNPRLMELVGIFVGEKTVKLVQDLDPNNIDPSEKVALQAIKSLSQKLEYAQKNPVWDQVKISGTVIQQGADWAIRSKEETLRLAGGKLDELKSRKGKPVVADGFVKMPGQFETVRFFDQKTNTLELFVMSFCPFGQRAETNLYSFLDRTAFDALHQKPNLELHYIFYKQQREGKEVFTSMHGEKEIQENLFQMQLREKHSQYLPDYLRLRASNSDAEWRQLATRAGLASETLSEIEKTITSQRETLIQREYDYAVTQYEIRDGSPTYVWEGEKVKDLKKIDAFKGLDGSPQEACSN